MTKLIPLLLVSWLGFASAFAATVERGYVTLESGDKVYRVQVKGESKAPPIVMVNGIVYSLSKWDAVIETLAKNEMSAVIYALPGQPENLRGVKRWDGMGAMVRSLTLKDLVVNLEQVLRATGLAEQKVVLFGASFGAAPVAEFAVTHPEQVAEVVLGVPLVVPLDSYDSSGSVVRSAMAAMRANERLAKVYFPWMAMSENFWSEFWWNQLYSSLLDLIIKDIPEGVDSELYKQGMLNLMHAVSDFDLNNYASRLKNVHEVIATEDLRDAIRDQYAFWNKLSPESRSSLLLVDDSHLLPEASPAIVATWLTKIATGSELTRNGKASRVNGQHLPVDNPYNPGGKAGGAGASSTTAPAQGPAVGITPELKKQIEAETALIAL